MPNMISPRQRYRPSAAARLQAILREELMRRRRVNPRYSLRAFSRSVEVEHSTISQLIRGTRPVSWKAIRHIAGTMRWTGSAVRRAAGQRASFDSRAIARQLGVTVDEVNVALSDLCLFGLIELKGE